jgi:hypothetical protein
MVLVSVLNAVQADVVLALDHYHVIEARAVLCYAV